MSNNKYYKSLDGIRALACLGIVFMHVLANGNYALNGILFEKIIPELKDLVFLFMVISGFATCCGYYQKVRDGVSLERFYKNRYRKIWPFFALLVIVDVVLSPSINALYEAFADLTLCFGLLPRAGGGITVIGVGWVIGVVFVFYLIFPFFCFLLGTKRRAWFSFCISVAFSYIGYVYFAAERTNIIFCFPFFLLGGIIYLYLEQLTEFSEKYKYVLLVAIVALFIIYYLWITNLTRILLYGVIVVFAIGVENKGVLINSITNCISRYSLEIYLCHMLVFRVLEKLHFIHALNGNEILSYIVCACFTFVGALLIAIGYSKVEKLTENIYSSRRSAK